MVDNAFMIWLIYAFLGLGALIVLNLIFPTIFAFCVARRTSAINPRIVAAIVKYPGLPNDRNGVSRLWFDL